MSTRDKGGERRRKVSHGTDHPSIGHLRERSSTCSLGQTSVPTATKIKTFCLIASTMITYIANYKRVAYGMGREETRLSGHRRDSRHAATETFMLTDQTVTIRAESQARFSNWRLATQSHLTWPYFGFLAIILISVFSLFISKVDKAIATQLIF